jgi:Na+-transporting NADH:ubiquinone oxidoreductase subunit C
VNKKSPAYVLAFMAAICVVFGTGIAVVNYATQGLLAKNAAMHRNRVLCAAFALDVDGTSADAYQRAVDANLAASVVDGRNVYRQTTPGSDAVGFQFGGMGFWDRIDGIVVMTTDLQTVLNVQFLDQKETPGLGARIEEKWFTDQFKGLRVDWSNPNGNFLVVGNSPVPDAKNRVDAITGATQTSMALGRFLNEELAVIRGLSLE